MYFGERKVGNFKAPKMPDGRKYLDSFRDRACDACGAQDQTIVAAHIRTGQQAGMGRKPEDWKVFGLCRACHSAQEAQPGPEWWLDNVLLPIAQRRYERWRSGR